MKVYAILAFVCIGVASAEWIQVWEDDFNGGDLKERWNFELGCSGKNNKYFLYKISDQ